MTERKAHFSNHEEILQKLVGFTFTSNSLSKKGLFLERKGKKAAPKINVCLDTSLNKALFALWKRLRGFSWRWGCLRGRCLHIRNHELSGPGFTCLICQAHEDHQYYLNNIIWTQPRAAAPPGYHQLFQQHILRTLS